MVGRYGTGLFRHGLLLGDGVFTTIDFPGALLTEAHGINNRGQIVGTYRSEPAFIQSFVFDKGTFTTIDVPEVR
jgi:hypothetical protein